MLGGKVELVKGQESWGRVLWDRMVRKGLSESLTLEQRPE